MFQIHSVPNGPFSWWYCQSLICLTFICLGEYEARAVSDILFHDGRQCKNALRKILEFFKERQPKLEVKTTGEPLTADNVYKACRRTKVLTFFYKYYLRSCHRGSCS